MRPASPRASRHDCRSARRHRPGDGRVVAARVLGRARLTAATGPGRAARQRRRPGHRRRAAAFLFVLRRALRRRSRVAALDPLARARRRRIRSARAAPRPLDHQRSQHPLPPGLAGGRPAAPGLARDTAWLGDDAADDPRRCVLRQVEGATPGRAGDARAPADRSARPRGRDDPEGQRRIAVAGPRRGRPARSPSPAESPGARVDDPRRLTWGVGNPRRGHPPGPAARSDLPARARRRRRDAASMRQIVGDVPLGGSPFPPIADYAFLSGCETTALVAPSGNVEWMCLPRMDGPSVFGAMLDRDAGGFRLGPADTMVPAGRRYLPGTMVLETTWGTRTGWVIIRDVLLIGPWHHERERSNTHRRSPTDYDADHVLLRTMRCVNGSVELNLDCMPKLDYGRLPVSWSYGESGYHTA